MKKVLLTRAYGLEPHVCFLSDSTTNTELVHLSGSNFVQLNLSASNDCPKSAMFPFRSRARVDFMCVTHDFTHLIVIENDSHHTYMSTIDLSSKFSLKKSLKLENESVICACVSTGITSHLLAGQTSKGRLIVWSIPQLGQVGCVATSDQVRGISFLGGGIDSKRILAIGTNLVKIFTFTSSKNELKPTITLTCRHDLRMHTWLNPKECLCADADSSGLFLIDFKSNEIKPVFDLSKSFGSTFQIRSLLSHGNLVFLLPENSDSLIVYSWSSKSSDHIEKKFTIVLKPRITNEHKKQVDKENIASINLSPSGKTLVAVSSHKLLYSLALNDERACDLLTMRPVETTESRRHQRRHYASITGLLTNSWIPNLVVSCSLDRHINIWNIRTGEMEMQRRFDDNEELVGVAIHPSGMFLLATTPNSIYLLGLYAEDPRVRVLGIVRVLKAIVCEFANADDMFAFVYGTVIKIYSFMKFEEIGAIHCHELGRIKQLKFSRNDGLLICCSVAGIVRIWNAHTQEELNDLVINGLSFTGMAIHQDNLFLISTEKSIRQYRIAMWLREPDTVHYEQFELVRKLDTHPDENVTCVEVNKTGEIVCIGTNKGSIRFYFLPSGVFKEIRAHFTHITRLCFAPRGDTLITSCEDGSCLVYSIDPSEVGKEEDLLCADLADADMFLADRVRERKRAESMRELRQRLRAANEMRQFETRKQALRYAILERNVVLSTCRQMEQIKLTVEKILAEYENNNRDFTNKLKLKFEAHFNDCERLRSNFDERIAEEENNINELEDKLKTLELNSPSKSTCQEDERLHLEKLDEEIRRQEEEMAKEKREWERRAEEQILLEEQLDEEKENEARSLLGEISRECAQVMRECLDRRDEFKIIRKEIESFRNQYNQYKKRRKVKEEIQAELCKKQTSVSEPPAKTESKRDPSTSDEKENEMNTAEIDREYEELLLRKSQLTSDLTEVAKKRAYYERELVGIKREMKAKKVELSRAKFSVGYWQARDRAREKVRLYLRHKRLQLRQQRNGVARC